MRERALLDGTMSRRRFLQASGYAAGASTLAALLGSCATSGGASGSTSTVKLTVTHWPGFLYGVPWAVAKQEALFNESGIELEGIVGSSGGGTTTRNVVTGDLPLGGSALPGAIKAFQSGADLRVLAGATQNTAEIAYVTRPDSAISSIEDLRGKRVGFTEPGSSTQAVILLALEEAGIDSSEVELKPTGGVPEGLTLLEKGNLDAAPNFLPLPSNPWKTVFPTTEHVPRFMSVALIAGGRTIEEDPELIRSLIEVYRQGVDIAVDNPNRAASAWVAESEVTKSDAERSLETIDRQSFYGTELSPGALNSAVRSMGMTGELNGDVNWDSLLDQRFLNDSEKADVTKLR